eukprot:384674_1
MQNIMYVGMVIIIHFYLLCYTVNCNASNTNVKIQGVENSNLTIKNSINEYDDTYYIKEWITLNNSVPSKSYMMIAGYDCFSSRDIVTIIGGVSNCYSIYEYNITSQKLTTLSHTLDVYVKSYPAYSYITLHNKIYFSNYFYLDINKFENFFIYDISDYTLTHTGTQHPKPVATSSECYATDGLQYIYLISTWNPTPSDDDPVDTRTFLIFNTKTNEWSVGSKLNEGRIDPACIYNEHDRTLYVFGGERINSIEKLVYSQLLNEWKLIDAKLFGGSFMEIYAYTIPYSNTIFIVGGYTQEICNIFDVDTQSIIPGSCYRRPIQARASSMIYVDYWHRMYSIGGAIDGVDTYSIQYAVTSGPILIILVEGASPISIGERYHFTPITADCTQFPDTYNFTLVNTELNINSSILTNEHQCLVCDANIKSDSHCWNCINGLLPDPHMRYIYQNEDDLMRFMIVPQNESANIHILTNIISVSFFPFLIISAADPIISPGSPLAIQIEYFQLRKESYYTFRLYSSNEAFRLDNILNIETTNATIGSCTVSTYDNPIKIPCDQGVSPTINYNYVTNENDLFNVSISPISKNANNLTTHSFNVKLKLCDSGYGIRDLSNAVCELCAYNSFTLTSNIKPCHKCCDDINGITCKGGNDVSIKFNYWLSALNTTTHQLYPFIDIKPNHAMSSSFCPPGYCCQTKGGCDYLEEYNKSSLCAFGRNLSSPLCGNCLRGLSELFGSTNCGLCDRTNYLVLILIFIFVVFPFVIYVAYFDSAPSKEACNQNDKSEQEMLLFKSLIFDIGIYYYQALSIVFLSKGITVSSWFESILLTVFNLQFG